MTQLIPVPPSPQVVEPARRTQVRQPVPRRARADRQGHAVRRGAPGGARPPRRRGVAGHATRLAARHLQPAHRNGPTRRPLSVRQCRPSFDFRPPRFYVSIPATHQPGPVSGSAWTTHGSSSRGTWRAAWTRTSPTTLTPCCGWPPAAPRSPKSTSTDRSSSTGAISSPGFVTDGRFILLYVLYRVLPAKIPTLYRSTLYHCYTLIEGARLASLAPQLRPLIEFWRTHCDSTFHCNECPRVLD